MILLEHYLKACNNVLRLCICIINIVYTNVEGDLRGIVKNPHLRCLVDPVLNLSTANALVSVGCAGVGHVVVNVSGLPEVHVAVACEEDINRLRLGSCALLVCPAVSLCIVGCKVIGYLKVDTKALDTEVKVLVVGAVVNRLNKLAVSVHMYPTILVYHFHNNGLGFKIEHTVLCGYPRTVIGTGCNVVTNVSADHIVKSVVVIATHNCVNVEEYALLGCAVKEHKTKLRPLVVLIGNAGSGDGRLNVHFICAYTVEHKVVIVTIVTGKESLSVRIVLCICCIVILGEIPINAMIK